MIETRENVEEMIKAAYWMRDGDFLVKFFLVHDDSNRC